MFLRSLLMGIAGAIVGAISMVIVSWLTRPLPAEAIYRVAAGGFVTVAVVDFVFEYFGLYKVNLRRRFFARKRD
jgi:hypothetical protein